MIVEDENLFKVKNDGTLDPLTLKKLTEQRREEFKKKINEHNIKHADKMTQEIIDELSKYRAQMKEDLDCKMSSAKFDFNATLDSNLNRFDQELNMALNDINKPLDLLDTSYIQEDKYKCNTIQNIFDLKDYMRNGYEDKSEIDKKLQEKLNEPSTTTESIVSANDFHNFECTSENPGNKIEKLSCFRKFTQKMNRIFAKVKNSCKFIHSSAFKCFKTR